jgi:DNA polymerase-3 subunit delta'
MCPVAKRARKPAEIEVPPPPAPEGPRPIALSAVIGQDRALAVLLDAVRSGRVHHAWIFHGPPGVGKFTAALAYAGLILDPTTQTTFSGELAPDPDSQVQRLLGAGTHPDLIVVTKELARYHEDAKVRDRKLLNIPVDVIRSFVIEPGKLGPALRNQAAAGKVFVIDEAELMAAPAQNAVLKFLEEPPERVVIVLVTASEDRLLPTIRSRCQRVFFSPLSDAAMEHWLKASGLELDADERSWLLRFSDGSPGVFALAKQSGMYGWWKRLEPMLYGLERGGYSVELGPIMAELIEGWAKAWVESHQNASKEAANKAGADWMLRLLANFLQGRLRKAAPLGKSGPYLTALDVLHQAELEIERNVNMLFVMEKISAELAANFGAAMAKA